MARDETFLQTVRHLSVKQDRTGRITCNLLGPTALGFRQRDDVEEITGLLADPGISVKVTAPLGASPADIARLPAV